MKKLSKKRQRRYILGAILRANGQDREHQEKRIYAHKENMNKAEKMGNNTQGGMANYKNGRITRCCVCLMQH